MRAKKWWGFFFLRQLADGNNVHWNVGPRFRNIVGDKMSQVRE